MNQPREVVIVGAGPAGVGMAALLRRSYTGYPGR